MDERKTKSVPAAALRFNVGEFAMGDNGDGAKSAPFRMVARSGQPIEHWFWGRVVHDLSGMRLAKSRVPIDYAHDDKEVIGYANQFVTENNDLEVSGALVPYKDSDRATEIIYKQKAGVPYEASINFGGDGIKLEEVPAGAVTNVNGYEFAGPGVVVREWPLRGIAICPYGADGNTSTEFSKDSQVTVEIKETVMPDEVKTEEIEQQTEEVVETVDAEKSADENTVEAMVAVEAEAASLGQRFLDAFGDQGGVWFAQGKSFEESQALFTKSLKERVTQLEAQLKTAKSLGEEEPAKFSEATAAKKKHRVVRIAGKNYED
jgi:hypothetical protein